MTSVFSLITRRLSETLIMEKKAQKESVKSNIEKNGKELQCGAVLSSGTSFQSFEVLTAQITLCIDSITKKPQYEGFREQEGTEM